MLIILNLLSVEQKQELRSRRLLRLTAQTTSVALTTLVVLTLLAAGGVFTMKKILEKVQSTSYAGSAEFNAKIKKINQLSALLNDTDTGHYRWSQALTALAAATPPDITLSAVRLDKAAGTMLVQGSARERSGLLQLQEQLRQSPLFSDVSIPLQDLSEKTNTDFRITITLNAEIN